MKTDQKRDGSVVRNQSAPEPSKPSGDGPRGAAIRLYGAACIKVGELLGMAKMAPKKQQSQLWRAYYEAVKVKDARFESCK
jgi:hypothetical protein